MRDGSELDQAWQTLMRSALLGSDRLPFIPSGASEALRFDSPPVDGALLLLKHAAFLAPLVRAGSMIPNRSGETQSAGGEAPPDNRPPANARAAAFLKQILAAPGRFLLLSEWLAECNEAGKRVPVDVLPDLLDVGRRRSLGPELARAVGARGFWLASQNPCWSYIIDQALVEPYPGAPEDLFAGNKTEDQARRMWNTAGKTMRLQLLRGLRNAKSPLALALVQETWDGEAASERAEIMTALGECANAGEAPFYEKALGERAREVRQAAASILMTLPGSALSERCLSRARALVRVVKPLLGAPRLHVAPPDDQSTDLDSDGFDRSEASAAGLGLKARMARFIVGAIPPAFWTDGAGARVTPEQFVAAARASDWSEAIVSGLRIAAIRFADPTMLELLVDPRATADLPWPLNTIGAVGLARRMDRAQRVSFELTLLEIPSRSLSGLIERVAALAQLPTERGICDIEVGRKFMEILTSFAVKTRDSGMRQPRRLAVMAGRCLPIEMTGELEEGWLNSMLVADRWREFAGEIQDSLAFRRNMIEEIKA